ncbi:DUF1129 family protein [Terrilactibacillus laevilacticus]|uniref:DUF1129 family protein n=1 Tax=Terrilactibacillus laevilacticus TaxID=1380157 RepID=A0ABW5PQA0_9BACI|nr:DUF1129 family protein [Terrilactibacillus laevilacticus]
MFQLSSQDMVEKNNFLRKQLTDENEKYYGDMMVYIRLSNINDRAGEELLLELLDHLITAQENGQTAQEIFGDDPESYCREIIDGLPKRNKATIIQYFWIIGLGIVSWGLIANGAFDLLGYIWPILKSKMSIINTGLNFLTGYIVVFGILYLMKKEVYKSKVWFLLAIILWGAAIFVPLFISIKLAAYDIKISIPFWLSFILGIAGILTSNRLIKKDFN